MLSPVGIFENKFVKFRNEYHVCMQSMKLLPTAD